MMKKLYLCVVITLILVFPTATVQANVLFQQTPDYFFGYYSDIPNQQIADDFSIASGGSITDVKWTGGYVNPMTDNFTLRFYSDNSGSPGTLLGSYAIGSAAGRNIAAFTFSDGSEVYTYENALSSSFDAAAGTKYWISILNGDEDNWSWADMDRTNVAAYRFGDSGSWFVDFVGNRAFELDGTTSSVPEPATMLLLGLGLVGLAGVRRKFKQ